MRYDISLSVNYTYLAASDQARKLLHLIPSTIPGSQSVIASLLTVDPLPHERYDAPDFFGNMATWISFDEPVKAITMTLKAQINRTAPAPFLDISSQDHDLAREIAAHQSLDPLSPHHFLGASPRVSPDPVMTDFARSATAPGATASEKVRAIGQALHAEMTFDAKATDVDTAPAEAFAKRRGVCQDFTHVMIAALRGIGIPAGYVSGFLRTTPPPGKPRLAGADAMHAWVRAWCGTEIGWVEFDPTNNTFAGEHHVVVAYGRDYSDVSPVRGILRTSGGHTTKHAVDVVPVPDPA